MLRFANRRPNVSASTWAITHSFWARFIRSKHHFVAVDEGFKLVLTYYGIIHYVCFEMSMLLCTVSASTSSVAHSILHRFTWQGNRWVAMINYYRYVYKCDVYSPCAWQEKSDKVCIPHTNHLLPSNKTVVMPSLTSFSANHNTYQVVAPSNSHGLGDKERFISRIRRALVRTGTILLRKLRNRNTGGLRRYCRLAVRRSTIE